MKKAEKVVQTLKNGQDKENTTSSIFERGKSGKPAFLGEETVEKKDKRQIRYIRIRDQTLWEKIDRKVVLLGILVASPRFL